MDTKGAIANARAQSREALRLSDLSDDARIKAIWLDIAVAWRETADMLEREEPPLPMNRLVPGAK
jgi:hypothetical protein